jgi:eukaryotic-like serine/threonine-protein kinase
LQVQAAFFSSLLDSAEQADNDSMSWQVGDYRAVEHKPFGQGQFGTVWRARRLSDDARVALKLVLRANGRDQIDAERHGAMLQQQPQRTHGMVPEIYDYGQDGDDFYIAMELIEGGQLADQIANGPLPPRTAAEHAAWLCGFLDKAHRFATTIEGDPYVAIVHADLKPQHVLFTASGEKKVLDFGIAKALARTTRVTTDNWCTTPYASPERLLTGLVDARVDLWSLGVILYEMVVGHRLYPDLEESQSRSQLEHAITTNAPREALPPACPAPLAAIINKLLAPQIERRYQDAASIRSDLDLFLSGREPAAMKEYATAPTFRIRNSEAGTRNAGHASPIQSSTVPIPSSASPGPDSASPISGSRFPIPTANVPPTDPLPVAFAGAVGVAAPGAVAAMVHAGPAAGHAAAAGAPAGSPAGARPLRLPWWGERARRAASIAFTIAIVAVIATEGGASVAAERFRTSIAGLEGRTLPHLKADYDGIRASSLLGLGLRLRVNRLLEQRLTALADTVIADYRREEPTLGPADWQQAQSALQWALELSPRDPALAAKQLTCSAHVTRHAARTLPRGSPAARQMYESAIAKFRSAAQVDRRSFDPYLGIARLAVYALDDVDQAAAAIAEAEKRGYSSGRREHAQLGDGYMRRADRIRRLARTLSGARHGRELENARADYERCVASFDPIVGFAKAADNLEYCRRQIERINTEPKPEVDQAAAVP